MSLSRLPSRNALFVLWLYRAHGLQQNNRPPFLSSFFPPCLHQTEEKRETISGQTRDARVSTQKTIGEREKKKDGRRKHSVFTSHLLGSGFQGSSVPVEEFRSQYAGLR